MTRLRHCVHTCCSECPYLRTQCLRASLTYVRVCIPGLYSCYKAVQICTHMYKYVQICTNMYKHVCAVFIFKDSTPVIRHYKYVPKCTKMYKYVQICANMYKYVQVCTHVYKYVCAVFVTKCSYREVGGWGRVPFPRNLMSPTTCRKWYLTTERRAH